MRLQQFTPDIAAKVLELWKRHLGAYNKLYHLHPEILVQHVIETIHERGSFESRIGSRYTDDSKLLAFIRDGLEFECYAQAQTVMNPTRRQRAEKAEEAFNKAVRKYIQTI